MHGSRQSALVPRSYSTARKEERRGLTPILPTCKIIKLQSENARRDDNPHFAKSATILNKRCSPLILPLPLKIVCTHTVEGSDMVKKSARRGGREGALKKLLSALNEGKAAELSLVGPIRSRKRRSRFSQDLADVDGHLDRRKETNVVAKLTSHKMSLEIEIRPSPSP